MTTAIKGVRYEMKRISGSMTDTGYTSILSNPSNSSYFIFINRLILGAQNQGARISSQTMNISSGADEFTYYDWSLDNTEKFVNYLIGETGMLLSNDFHDRLIHPSGSLQMKTSGLSAIYRVYYTEVYFGGLSDY